MLFRNQKTKRTNFSSPMFPQISKVWSMLYHRSVRRVQSKQCSSLFTDTFFGIFLFLFIKKLVYHFTFFFLASIKFPQQNINQSETGIGDMKLSVELYVYVPLRNTLASH